VEILKKVNSNVPINVYRGESEDELINKLDELARGVEYYNSVGVMEPTLGTLLLVKDDESVSFLSKDSFHGWNIICSGVALQYMKLEY
jgi:biotin synthase-related radical SAM superfamily protein